MHIEYKFDTREIQDKFQRLAKVMDGREITRKVSGVLRQESEKAFDKEKTPEGENWVALNDEYKKRRDVAGYTGKILQVRGDLVTSLNIDYGNDYAVIGASENYGQFHQMGTKFMPARPFLGLGDSGNDEIKAILNRELSKSVQK